MAGAYIGVSGNIGSGKSSLVDFLRGYFKLDVLMEPNEQNPYLAEFYSDMPRWALHSQLWFLSRKIAMFDAINAAHGAVIQDRILYEDAEIFCRNLYELKLMSARDYELYGFVYERYRPLIRPPDLLIHLHCPLKTTLKRIKLRGRFFELGMSRKYIESLDRLYGEWIARYDAGPVVRLDTSELDFVHDLIGKSEVINKVKAALDANRPSYASRG